ncbi:helix-turn-helix domain-containing protein [Streptomyces sp. NPDC001312]|uniref:helix-turn-helix domain-containing protein n=1 Tax=Streptomyces sp. NPDC001312 TaxID=3364561 RepID=UPI0036BF2C94
MLADPEASISSIAKLIGVSRTTLYKHVPELKTGGRPALGATSPTKGLATAESHGEL